MLANLFKKKRKNEDISKLVSWGHWFCLFNILLSFLIASVYLFDSPWPKTILGQFYEIISLLGHFSFIGFAIYLLILFPLTFFINSIRPLKVIAIMIAVFGLGLLIIDVYIYHKLGVHLNTTLLFFFIYDQRKEMTLAQVSFCLIIISIIVIEFYYAKWSWKKLRSLTKRKFGKILLILFTLCFLGSHLIHIWADATFYRPITAQKSNLPLSYPMTARHFLEKYGLLDLHKYEAQKKSQGNPNAMLISYPLAGLQYVKDIEQPYNVLLIVLPQLEYKDWQKNMPNLTQFATNNLNYTRYYNVAANSNLTAFSLLYGILPYYYNSVLAEYKPSALLTAFSHNGYQINLYSADKSHLLDYLFELVDKSNISTNYYYNNKQLTYAWLKGLTNQGDTSPWFSYINYTTEDSKSDNGANFELAQLDNALKKIFCGLQTDKLLSHTVVIITATNSRAQSEQTKLPFDLQEVQVPLIIHWPNYVAQVQTKLTNELDIVPTLMQQLLNVVNPIEDYAQGTNLFDPNYSSSFLPIESHKEMVLLTDKFITLLQSNGGYDIYDHQFNIMAHQTINLSHYIKFIKLLRQFTAQ